MKNQLFAVEVIGGRIGIISAPSIEVAKRRAFWEEGTANVQSIKPATKEEIAWVLAMGGHIRREEECGTGSKKVLSK